MPRLPVLIVLLFTLLATHAAPAGAQAVTVPPGNVNAVQPEVPAASRRRTRGSSFDAKYRRIRDLIARDADLRGKIARAAAAFGIDPIHIVGALVGEHTYNVDAKDRLQTYYVKALSYLGQSLAFEHDGVSVERFIAGPAFAQCRSQRRDYDRWSCIERVWDTQYRGRSRDGRRWPDDRFGRVFFQPLYAGQTFGLGQLNPLTALKVNDLVRRVDGSAPRLSVRDAPRVYNVIMEPDSTLLYMAAVLRHAIDAYREIAGMDISRNPGLTATLYNLGNVTARARLLAATNSDRLAKGEPPRLPRENYYGWLVNEREGELRSIL